MKFVVVFVTFTIIAAVNGQSDAQWEEYKKIYGKDYQKKSFNGQNEEVLRKNQFVNTYAAIQKANSNPQNLFKQGINVLSDMFPNEIDAMMGTKKPMDDKGTNLIRTTMNSENRQALPTSLDYRTHQCMTPIRNQGACGSCWSYSAINPLEFSACNKTQVLIPLSEQHLIDCDIVYDHGCKGGWPMNGWGYLKTYPGSAQRVLYPQPLAAYTSQPCQYTAAMLGATVSTFGYVGSTSLAMQQALLQYGPLSVAITSVPSFHSYASSIYNDVACDNLTINHGINVVGYGTTSATGCSSGTDYWIIRNSWGTSWGLLGYGMIQRGVNKCSIESYPMFVVAGP